MSIANSLFTPTAVTIATGGTVTWTNADAQIHTVTAADNSWDSGTVAKSVGTYQHTFTTRGTYAYICSYHPEMTATVIVVDAAGNTPPATSPAPATTPSPTTPPATPPASAATPAATTPGAGATPAALPMLVQVALSNNLFAPRTISVAVGGTVRWTNNDTAAHTVTAGDTSFDSGILAKAATFERAFPTAGTYAYVCAIHSGMTGTVIAAANPTAAAAAAAVVPTTPVSRAAPVTRKAVAKKPATHTAAKTSAPAPATASVSMKGSVFGPATVTIRPGGKVTWVNNDSVVHTVTAADSSFDSGMVAIGARYEHTYATAGTYRYKCSFHTGMVGTVIAAAAVGSVGRATAARATGSTTSSATGAGGATAGQAQSVAPPKGSGAIKASVEMRDNLFAPANLTVPVGSTVTFTNTGKAPHTATAADKSFDSKIVPPGAKWSTTFTKIGTFKYVCIIHPGMAGSVTVTKDDASQAVASVPGGSQGASPPATPAEGTPSASGGQVPSAVTGSGSASYRGVALLVSGLVIGGGLLYLLGMLIVEDTRWRKAAVRTVKVTAVAWRTVFARLMHPIHPRSRPLRIGLHH